MKQNDKQRLFEILSKIDNTYKPTLNENLDLSQEQQILNDILSVNENSNDWWNKFIQYGKKGLLTATIVLALSMSSYATNENKNMEVINVGLEMLNSNEKIDMLNFLIGYTTQILRTHATERNLEIETYNGYISLRSYAMHVRRGGRRFAPNELFEVPQQLLNEILTQHSDLDLNQINGYIDLGKTIK